MSYSFKLKEFEGPLDLLLQLIEQEEMDISKVSLAHVTEQYLQYLNDTPNIPTEELADFLVVAAKLLLIKSRILLPNLQAGEEDDGSDLERQLKLYKEFYDASKVLNKIVLKKQFLFSRERPAVAIGNIFNPPKHLTAEKLQEFFADVLRELEPWVNLPRQMMARTISIRERIANIHAIIKKEAELSFHHLLKTAHNKTEVIVTFLALLELVKQRSIMVVQDGVFNEIMVKKINDDDITNKFGK